jgi:xanthine/CO dehydrogenase XdhC/CoxF family maturation factor
MRVLLEPAGPASAATAALAAAGVATGAGLPASLVAIHESTQYALGTYARLPESRALAAAVQSLLAGAASGDILIEEGGVRTRAFVQYLAPPPFLLICGAGPDAQPVASAARGLGWRVAVFDHRPAYAVPERFPGATVHCAPAQMLRSHVDLSRCHAAVVMSHHLASDTAYLRQFAEESKPGYIGLLGPAARRRRLAEDLGAAADALRSRLHGPVGIDVGAVTPEGIALSIVAQIHAWLAGREMA